MNAIVREICLRTKMRSGSSTTKNVWLRSPWVTRRSRSRLFNARKIKWAVPRLASAIPRVPLSISRRRLRSSASTRRSETECYRDGMLFADNCNQALADPLCSRNYVSVPASSVCTSFTCFRISSRAFSSNDIANCSISGLSGEFRQLDRSFSASRSAT